MIGDKSLSTRDLAGSSEQGEDSSAVAVGDDHDRDEADLEEGVRPEKPEDVAGAAAHPLVEPDEAERFKLNWQRIQASFVDEPRRSVQEADSLVADLMQQLAASFSNERESLEGQWDRGDEASTEDLRIVLTRYRSFFERLLAA